MVMLGQRWERALNLAGLYIDLNTNTLIHMHEHIWIPNTCRRMSKYKLKADTNTTTANHCTHAHTHTHTAAKTKTGMCADTHTNTFITAGSARDAPAQRASVQTLNTDHRQAGQCFILAREHYRLITPPWRFEAGARFGPHKPIFGPVWMRAEALMDRARAGLSSGLVLIM